MQTDKETSLRQKATEAGIAFVYLMKDALREHTGVRMEGPVVLYGKGEERPSKLPVRMSGLGGRLFVEVDVHLDKQSRFHRYPTGSFVVTLSLPTGTGAKRRYVSDDTGKVNLDKMLKAVKESLDYYRGYEEARAKAQAIETENARVKAEQLGQIEVPEGVEILRDPGTGKYQVRIKGDFNGLDADQVKGVLGQLSYLGFKGQRLY